MSPSQVLDRTYAALKQQLRQGVYPPGHRLDALRIADALDVSITPVRDVLHRLTGERLVRAVPGDGFYVPVLIEEDLRDLIAWNLQLLLLAARDAPAPIKVELESAPCDHAERTAALFASVASLSTNRELHRAVEHNSDRLNPYRLVEHLTLFEADAELQDLDRTLRDGCRKDIARLLRRYHLRRQREAGKLIRALRQ